MSTPSSHVPQTLPTIQDLPYDQHWEMPLTKETAPRPSNAFFLFLQWNSALGNLAGKHPTKATKELWSQASQTVQDHFYDLARQVKAEHLKRYPGYEYHPKPTKKTKTKTKTGRKENARPYTLTSREKKRRNVRSRGERVQRVSSLPEGLDYGEDVPSAGASTSFAPSETVSPSKMISHSTRRLDPMSPLTPIGQPSRSRFDMDLGPQSLPFSLLGALGPQPLSQPSAPTPAPPLVEAFPSDVHASQVQAHFAADTQQISTETTDATAGWDNESQDLFAQFKDTLQYLAVELTRSLPDVSGPEENQRSNDSSGFDIDEWLVFED